MEKTESSRELSNSGEANNYLENEIKCMIIAYRRLEKLNPHQYLLTLIRVEKDEKDGEESFVSTPKFMNLYYGILNKKGESIKDVIKRDKNAVNLYRKDLEDAVSKG